MAPLDSLPSILLFFIAYGHVFLTTYTKVEESFSLHAVHDLLTYGVRKAALVSYDHHTFPGAVPRSFIGPVLLSAFTAPLLYLGKAFEVWTSGMSVQILVRLVLATINCSSILFLAHRVRLSFGKQVAQYTLLITATQFHVLYYASRTLPNMFAFPLVQIALGLLIASQGRRGSMKTRGSSRNYVWAFGLLTFAAVVLRLELIALVGPLAMDQLRRSKMTFVQLGFVGTAVGALSLALTTEVDSLFWGRRVWPEGAAIFFNVIQGHSSDWGTSPWHYYFLVSLPRILNLSYPFAILSMFIDTRARQIGYPSLMFIGLLSYLKHKEWRFFVYIIPTLNVCAAAGITSLSNLVSKRAKHVALAAIVATNLALGLLSLIASMNNYPGGNAITFVSSLRPQIQRPLTVHMSSHAAQTGASLFLHSHQAMPEWYLSPYKEYTLPPGSGLRYVNQPPPTLIYDKNESMKSATDYATFDYVLADQAVASLLSGKEWEKVKTFGEFAGYRIQTPRLGRSLEKLLPLKENQRNSVWVLENKR